MQIEIDRVSERNKETKPLWVWAWERIQSNLIDWNKTTVVPCPLLQNREIEYRQECIEREREIQNPI